MVFVRMLQVFWFAPVDLVSVVVQAILLAIGWVKDIDVEADDGVFRVRVWIASGWLGKKWPLWPGGCAWLPGCVLLNPRFFTGDPNWLADHLEKTLVHELEHCRQWRQWSFLFPFAYGIAALVALPHAYYDNYFEKRARAAVSAEAS
jgi:hypothetical protein